MKKLMMFENPEGYQLRCTFDETIWYSAKDISNILGLHSEMIAVFVASEDTKVVDTIDKIGRETHPTMINKYALHKLMVVHELFAIKSYDFRKLRDWIETFVDVHMYRANGIMISESDKVLLKVIKANTEEEREQALMSFKNKKVSEKKSNECQKLGTSLQKHEGIFTLNEATEYLGLKKSQITQWAGNEGLLSKDKRGNLTIVTDKGQNLFVKSKGYVMLTDTGIKTLEINHQALLSTPVAKTGRAASKR